MLSLDGVSKRFGGRAAVEDATLAVGAGERLALVGPSGCGKSTLLKIVLGIVTSGLYLLMSLPLALLARRFERRLDRDHA